jgi:hypothetical protein
LAQQFKFNGKVAQVRPARLAVVGEREKNNGPVRNSGHSFSMQMIGRQQIKVRRMKETWFQDSQEA